MCRPHPWCHLHFYSCPVLIQNHIASTVLIVLFIVFQTEKGFLPRGHTIYIKYKFHIKYEIIESWNHSMSLIGRDHKCHLVPKPLPWAGLPPTRLCYQRPHATWLWIPPEKREKIYHLKRTKTHCITYCFLILRWKVHWHSTRNRKIFHYYRNVRQLWHITLGNVSIKGRKTSYKIKTKMQVEIRSSAQR